jgi:hypothetical protein
VTLICFLCTVVVAGGKDGATLRLKTHPHSLHQLLFAIDPTGLWRGHQWLAHVMATFNGETYGEPMDFALVFP